MSDNFIKSLLYNQVPITAYMNRRAMLAFLSLLFGFILLTFMLPFFALIRNRTSYDVSIQLTAALGVFCIVASLPPCYCCHPHPGMPHTYPMYISAFSVNLCCNFIFNCLSNFCIMNFEK